MKFKDDSIILDGSVHIIRIIVNNAGTVMNHIITSIFTTQSFSVPNGSGITVVQNGVWICYYGVNDVFSCRDENFLPFSNNKFDHDDNADAGAMAIVDIAGDCVAAAA